MQNLVLPNILSSLHVFIENTGVPENLVEVRDERTRRTSTADDGRAAFNGLCGAFARASALNIKRPVPWFYRDQNGHLRSAQERFFGFYALRNAIRGSLMAARMIQAGVHLEKGRFLAPSVSMYYTGAFHALTAFLALRGRALVETVLGRPVVVLRDESTCSDNCQMDRHPEAVIAILTRDNRWVFEPRARTHQKRWEELHQVFSAGGREIPDYLVGFCRYLTRGEVQYADPRGLVERGLRRLVEMRHDSIYMGYGFDDDVYYDLINRARFSDAGIDLRARSFRAFATGMLIDSIETVHHLKGRIEDKVWNDVRPWLVDAVAAPPFEGGEPTLEGFPDQTKILRDIDAWLYPDTR